MLPCVLMHIISSPSSAPEVFGADKLEKITRETKENTRIKVGPPCLRQGQPNGLGRKAAITWCRHQ